VTVGSTRFDRLIDQVLTEESADQLNRLGFACLVLQAGSSDYDIKRVDLLRKEYKIDVEIYDYKSSIKEDIERADVVISHAGAGTCLEVLRANKRLLVVVNDTLMHNHQSELADELSRGNFVVQTSVENIPKSLDIICDTETKLEKFPPKDGSKFEKIFETALEKANSSQ